MKAIEWLNELISTGGYQNLLDDAGLAIAAWRIASARRSTRCYGSTVPTRIELRGAAIEISNHLGLPKVPPTKVMVTECEANGLRVL